MPIKYGEFACILNDEDFFNNIFSSWFNTEITDHKNSKIVILFEDGEICEINDKLKDFKYEFLDGSTMPTPRYFDKNNTAENNTKNIYFKQEDMIIDSEPHISFKNLFKSYSKYSSDFLQSSIFNSIYYHYKNGNQPEVFGIARLKSSESKPRFQLAYDSDEFSKEEVIYLINYIFKK